MKTLGLGLVALGCMLVSESSRADGATPEPIQTYAFDTCNFFMYSNEIRAYVCASTGGRITAPSAVDSNRALELLTQRVAELEARLKKLEPPTPTP